MLLYAQHGYRKSDKINRGFHGGILQGVIMSPRNESPGNLTSYISELYKTFPKVPILFDPQFYVSTVTPVRDGNLPDYDYYQSELTRRNFTLRDITQYVRDTLDYQKGLPVSHIISPTVLFDDFRDPWSQIALHMAQESINYHGSLRKAPPLLISLVISETALRSVDSLNEYLDLISLLNVQGFYIIIRRETTRYTPQMEPGILENLLYLVYTLSEINEYKVVVGYADVIGILLQAVGAYATACGWFNSLRQFTLARFQPTTGGRAARARYTSIPLLNSILIIPELVSIYDVGMIDDVLTGTSFDSVLRSNPADANWILDQSSMHHWEALSNTIKRIKKSNVRDRIVTILKMIASARALYSRFSQNGVVFEQFSGPGHLDQWKRAISNFQSKAGLK